MTEMDLVSMESIELVDWMLSTVIAQETFGKDYGHETYLTTRRYNWRSGFWAINEEDLERIRDGIQ